jgi:hypothetical protein
MDEPKAGQSVDLEKVAALLTEAKRLARDYYRLTGRPLGITGEVAEHEACRLLGLRPAPVRQQGFDATRKVGDAERRVQVKGRVLLPGAGGGQRLGKINLKHEWESVVVVVLDENFEATIMYEAERAAIEAALNAPGSISRNDRGQLGISKFKAIGRKVWERA